jgi:hypothetical protein
LGSIRSWVAATVTIAAGVIVKRRVRVDRMRLRPRVTPMRLIHPDELAEHYRRRKAS